LPAGLDVVLSRNERDQHPGGGKAHWAGQVSAAAGQMAPS